MRASSASPHKKVVLIFQDYPHLDSVYDKIVALGYSFQTLPILGKPLDWENFENELKQQISSVNLLTVLVFLSRGTIFKVSSTRYLELWDNLLGLLKITQSLILIDKDSLLEDLSNPEIKEINKSFDDIDLMINRCLLYNVFNPSQNIDMMMFEVSDIISAIDLLTKNIDNLTFLIDDLEIKRDIEVIKDLKSDVTKQINTKEELSGIIVTSAEDEKTKLSTAIDIKSFMRIIKNNLKYIKTLIDKRVVLQSQNEKQVIEAIRSSGIDVVPYETRSEVSIRVHHFLDEIDKGILLHLYVPNGRYQEDQLASFLRLFESYLQHVEKLPFFIDIRKTSHGQVYEFKSSDSNINLTDMKIAFSRFEDFMGLCQNDLASAETLLKKADISPREANRLMTKFIKEYRRLLLDIEHERKRKLLEIELRLESDIFELTNATDFELLQSTTKPTALLSLSSSFDPVNITISNSSVSINSGTQSFIEQAIYGDIHYTPQDKELIHLFEKYAEQMEAVQLRSSLEELKDTSSPEAERKNSMQKIVGFLLNKVAPAVGQSALTVLTAYLQKILTGS